MENIKMMRPTIQLIPILILILLSCNHPDEPVHSSYIELNRFLKQENLYQTLDIEKVDVGFVSISDFKDYRPDNKVIHNRKLEAIYDFTITGRNKAYLSKATVVSTDSILWRIKTLVVKEKADSSNTATEKTYTWDLSKDPIKWVHFKTTLKKLT